MKVFIERTKETREVPVCSVDELLRMFSIILDEVLVVRNGKLVTEDEVLAETDEIKILSVISGG